MFNNSTQTADDIRRRLEIEKGENVQVETLVSAINEVIDIVDRVRWDSDKLAMQRRTTSPVTITKTSGYDLSGISDLGDIEIGFTVFKDSVSKENQLLNKGFMAEDRGYYIEGSTIYSSKNESLNVLFVYMAMSDRVTPSTVTTYRLPIPRQLETSFYNYLQKNYYEGEFQFDLEMEATRKFIEDIKRIFADKKRVALI